MKHVVTALAVGVWLCMVAALVHRQTPPPASDLGDLGAIADASTDAGREEWFGIYRGERKIGHARRLTEATPSGHRFRDETRMTLAMLGSPQPLATVLAAETDRDFALRSFRFSLVSAATSFLATGTTDGHRLDVRYGTPGRSETVAIPLGAPVYLPSTLRPRIAAARGVPGTRYTEAVFSPFTLRTEPLTVVVEGRESLDDEEVVRISEEQQGLRARAWLAADGSTVREEGMLGLVLRRESRERALAGEDQGDPLDVALSARIPVDGTIADPRERRALTLRLRGAAADRIPDDPPRQRVTGDLLRIVREPDPAPGPTTPGVRPALAQYAGPAPFIESDAPEIAAQARVIVGRETDPSALARRLVRWVHENVAQEPTLTIPSARDVLRARRGDCNEQAVLLAALSRAAGIPARVVAGAVYLDDGFYYHAWTELWLDRWVTADPIFGQIPVDPTHVKLLEGGPAEQVALAGVIGRLAFAVVEPGS